MRRSVILVSLLLVVGLAFGQDFNSQLVDGQSCTSIMVGKKASTDGSVITSHTCDGRYRTWMTMEPARDYKAGERHTVRKGTMHTAFRNDTTGVKVAGTIPQVRHTYAYLNTAYPCLNEKQLAIGETTFGGLLKKPLPILSVMGDSHAALYAQGCHKKGMVKTTYGTGFADSQRHSPGMLWPDPRFVLHFQSPNVL